MDFGKVKADEVTLGLEQMFVLSVLFKKHEMSKIIWTELDEPVFAALAVKRLHQIVIDLAEIKDSEILMTYAKISNEFTDLAVGVIDACYENKSSNYILRRQLKYWKDGSVLSIASEVENRVFISRPACQELLDSIWWGNDKLENNTPRTRTISIKRPVSLRKRSRLKQLSTAPVAKFLFNSLSYIVFLGLYSYHMLVSFKPQFNVFGGILCFWVFTLVCEEIRQLSIIKSNSTESMLGKYIGQSLNILDILTVSLFIIGIILRSVPNASSFEAARVVFCINLILCFVRLLRMFVPNEQLGPKLVMINRMIWRDLLPFLAIFVLFIVAYAIASEAILYPNTELTWKLVYQLPRKAYWQIYGELFLENIEDVNLDYKTHLYYDNVERREAKACLQKRKEEFFDNSKHVFQRLQSDLEEFINTPKSEKPSLNKDDFRTEIKKLRQSFKKEISKVQKEITKTVDDKINETLKELMNSPRKP
ncbi:transient receptor potential cation channel subfamily M member 2 isoform X1 [Patella vulgata]|uniref:transient receptor potential cation channel subfamily M member 2 isoform X1 n=1 Tax=Patella vulgata TaxID=6465 RepID=UPI0024A8FF5B|nr:transient receptor potential cation channel subfamily M member 2 isoform X1 [Patella vulgata]